MIISITDLKKQVNCGSDTDDLITTRLEAIESVIRTYTHNNFQVRAIRIIGNSLNMDVYGVPQFFTAGDTVEISQSGVNDGLYTITQIGIDHIKLNRYLNEVGFNVVTKVVYPADVVQCAVDLYRWKQNMGDKVGIKSETISRHSVTYEDSGTLFMGYPVGILKGLSIHKKARC